MSTRNLTCIGCPMGCQLTAELAGGEVVSVRGNTCARGEAYARKECTHPARTVTGTVRCEGGVLPVVSVRTADEVPKEKVFAAPLVFYGQIVVRYFIRPLKRRVARCAMHSSRHWKIRP